MCKGTCTNNELGEFLVILGIGKRTGHSTLKNAKEKASPHNTLPQIQAVQHYKTITGITVSKYNCLQRNNCLSINTIQSGNLFPEEAFKYHRPEREGFLPYEP